MTVYSFLTALRFSRSHTTAGSESVGMMPTYARAFSKTVDITTQWMCSCRRTVKYVDSAVQCCLITYAIACIA